MIQTLQLAQGAFYVLTGLWPIVHLRSFESVTGAKRDKWLVRAFGALIAVIGSALLLAAYQGESGLTLSFLAGGSALCTALIDIVSVVRAGIARIYLVDASAELILAALWTPFLFQAV